MTLSKIKFFIIICTTIPLKQSCGLFFSVINAQLDLFIWALMSQSVILTHVTIFLFLTFHSDALPRPRVLQLIVTNMRNRSLSSTAMGSRRESFLSLYHNLTTGSNDFPLIHFKGTFHSCQMVKAIVDVEQEQRENTTPSPFVEGPSSLMLPTAGSRSTHRTILTPVLLERTELGALMADRRNTL